MTTTKPGRRKLRAWPALAVAILFAFAGCAAGESSDTSQDLVPPAEGNTKYPLTLQTWAGDTVLEERPERIAVIGFSPNVDALEALGVTPVYIQGEETEWPWRDAEWLEQIEYVDAATRRDPINFEAIASTNPDLIVAVNFIWDESDYERLTDIAPVLENAEQIDGEQIEWQETQRLIGEALDLGDAAEQTITDAEQAIADTADAYPEFAGKTITITADYTETGIDYYTVTGGTAEGIVEELGFVPNPLAENFVDENTVSDENLGLLDGDVLVVFYMDDELRQAREQMPLFQSLPPVAEERYISVITDGPGGEVTWVLRRGASVLSVPWGVETLADWLVEVELS